MRIVPNSNLAYIKKLFILFVLLSLSLEGFAQYPYPTKEKQEEWAEEVLNTMSFEDMLAQMLMVPAWTKNESLSDEVIDAVEKHHVGGVIFFQGTAQTHAQAIQYLQQTAKIPLLIGMDAEWGAAMRLDHLHKFPYPLTIGASQDANLAYEIGRAQGKQLKRLGVHINFAPVVDLNINPNNPIIGFRSFGDQADQVGKLASAFNSGLEHEGVWGCAKHFPGHGNTNADSHKELPLVNHNKSSLKKELKPFDILIEHGVKSVMVAHLRIPYLDNRPNMPSSLSPKIVSKLLRNDLGFNGLIITDAMNMKGISAHYKNDEAVRMAINAGNDIICFVDDIPSIMSSCRAWLKSGWVDSITVRKAAKRILESKFALGLKRTPHNVVQLKQLLEKDYNDFLGISDKNTNKEDAAIDIASKSLCLLGKHNLPWATHTHDSLWLIAFGGRTSEDILGKLNFYHHTEIVWAHQFQSTDELHAFVKQKKGPKLVFNGAQKMWSNNPRELPKNLKIFLESMKEPKDMVFLHTGNIYALQGLRTAIPVLLGMETGVEYQKAAIDALFGQRSIPGKLPVDIDEYWTKDKSKNLISYAYQANESNPQPNDFLCNEYKSLSGIMDSIVLNRASQTAQLLVLKNGSKVYNISRGKDPIGNKINEHSIYDIASITKLAATTVALMKCTEDFRLDLSKPISTYWKEAESYPWSNTPIYRFLIHRSGLPPYLPLKSILSKHPLFSIHRDSMDFSKGMIDMGDSLDLPSAVKDSVWYWICHTEPKSVQRRKPYPYVYSDLNAIILARFVEHLTKESLSSFCDKNFYRPLGMHRTGFLPKRRQLEKWTLPTQIDSLWPRGKIQATVHDPTSALMGGIAGNAGLFSTAHDLANLMQMICNGGKLNGKRYFNKSTVDLFTQVWAYDENHRGLGFDKPNGFPNQLKHKEYKGSNLFDYAPLSIFGHSGFTGTWVWADPKEDLVFIFLSNRTYPNDRRNSLAKKGYRGLLMEIVYRSLRSKPLQN